MDTMGEFQNELKRMQNNSIIVALIVIGLVAMIAVFMRMPEKTYICGDNACSPVAGESRATCPSDCTGFCGDGVCEGGEACSTCVDDCGTCSVPDVTVRLIGDANGNATVTLKYDTGAVIGKQSGDKGKFVFEGVPAGKLIAVVEGSPGNKIESPAAEATSIDITIPDGFFGKDDGPRDESNVFIVLNQTAESEFRDRGYAIVRYFYKQNCQACEKPVDWELVLRGLAAEMKGEMALEIINMDVRAMDAQRWLLTGQDMAPVIRIDGEQYGHTAYKLYYFGPALSAMEDTPAEKLREEICKFTEKC